LVMPTLLELGNIQPLNMHMEVSAKITFDFEGAFVIILCKVYIFKVSFSQETDIDILEDC
jgi:hypothetical protein